MTSAYYIGIMSGTSLDGIDVALVDSQGQTVRLISTQYAAYPDALKNQLLALHHPSNNELENTLIIANQLAHLYADAVLALLTKNQLLASDIVAIGCHGQTIRHRPELGFSLQIGNNALLAELTKITVCGDFRSRDIAAGGQGAPLVPAFHQAAFASKDKNRAIVNIGGIANITYLSKSGNVLGFDSGPGNLLLNSWIKLKLDLDYDADGAWAATGVVHQSFLDNMLSEPFFALPPPKSTGRDLFNDTWLKQHILYPHCRPQDIAHTLLELTACSIQQAITSYCPEIDEVYICGGGAHNKTLMTSLKLKLGAIPLHLTDTLGINVDWVEAAAFAWLAKQCLTQQTSNLPSVTGAVGPRILGAIFPA
jgi:anhydro-N-acetylmuramic acid kinase